MSDQVRHFEDVRVVYSGLGNHIFPSRMGLS